MGLRWVLDTDCTTGVGPTGTTSTTTPPASQDSNAARTFYIFAMNYPFVACVLLVGFLIFLCRSLSPRIYDVIIVRMTAKWYAAFFARYVRFSFSSLARRSGQPPMTVLVRKETPLSNETSTNALLFSRFTSISLRRVRKGDRVLDVGIGTASALARNARTVRALRLRIVGVDYEQKYVSYSRGVLFRCGLKDSVRTICASIYDKDLSVKTGAKSSPFDVVYFSGSISLMPDPSEALRAAAKLLRPGGRIYITQTFQNRDFPLLSVAKPLLKYLTTVDFGRLIFQREMLAFVEGAGMRVLENKVISGSVENRWQSARMLVLTPGS